MPLVLEKIEGEFCPVVICDQCGERIEDARDGNYHWNPDEQPTMRVHFTHKACCWAFDREQKPNGITYADELADFTWYLRRNLSLETPGSPLAKAFGL